MSAARTMRTLFALAAISLPFCARGQMPAVPVDRESVDRGADIFAQRCAQCHGPDARGTQTAPDLIRSLVVLHDRAQQLHGTEMAALLKKAPTHNFDFSESQLADISQFLTREVNLTLRSGYSNQPTNMLSGDAHAGEVFFNGAGGCSNCHSPTGDLAGIATKYAPDALQQKFVFPATGRGAGGSAGFGPAAKRRVTVTPPSGKPVSGTLVKIDDFNVSLVDASGANHSWTRVPGMKVEVVDPYAAHIALLDKYTDADIHNMTAYLETLK
jgi:cytochrome c oxidase cbb3-type subunit III